jgi:hypothetical protein
MFGEGGREEKGRNDNEIKRKSTKQSVVHKIDNSRLMSTLVVEFIIREQPHSGVHWHRHSVQHHEVQFYVVIETLSGISLLI